MKPLFQGKSEIDQLNIIFKELGTPSEKIWPGYSELPIVKKINFVEVPYNNLHNRIGHKLGKSGFDLINRFLTYCPARRITADEALKHEFFNESPLPVNPAMFPTWPAKSEGGQIRKAQSPKAPSGGKKFAEADIDEEKLLPVQSEQSGFHINVPISKKGFNIRF